MCFALAGLLIKCDANQIGEFLAMGILEPLILALKYDILELNLIILEGVSKALYFG